jgi:DAPG hydrolase PhiG domain
MESIFLSSYKQFCLTLLLFIAKTIVMSSSDHKYAGYKPADFKTPFAKFYQENVLHPNAAVQQALQQSPLPAGKLPGLDKVALLSEPGYADVENGYSIEADGSVQVVALTPMPGVAPYMWDWWFGWHGCMDSRYKLWHPQAHLSAAWADGDQTTVAYVGRTSMIQEYIGPNAEKANISFIPPAELGIDPKKNNDLNQVVFICARIGYTSLPVNFGWLVHQVRATESGAEMRSRFWLGGKHIQFRGEGFFANFISKLLQKVVRLPKKQLPNLLIHCAEEMQHLAAFLPQLYAEFHQPS